MADSDTQRGLHPGGEPATEPAPELEVAEAVARYYRRAEAWEQAAEQEEAKPDRTSYRAQVARHCRNEAADWRALADLLAAAARAVALPDAALIAAAERVAVKVFPRDAARHE